jgi:hypothetical protein
MHVSVPFLTLFPLLTTAHFIMHYPASRNGLTDDTEPTPPCGGYPVSSSRTNVSLPAFPIALEMEHDEVVIQILLSLSDNPTSEDDFNITLERTFQEEGLGMFCLPQVTVPEGAGVKSGMRGTVQVVTDGEGGGGLYVVSIPLPRACFFLSRLVEARCVSNDLGKNEANVEAVWRRPLH